MSSTPQPPQVEADLAEARATLRATEEHFRLLVETVRDYAIFLLDPSGRVATWNNGAARIKGYAANEIVGRHFSSFYPESDLRDAKCAMELEVATKEGRFEDEGWRVRKDGSQFWANVVITALRDETGTLVGFAKVTRDLTERRLAEEERIRLAAEQKAREASETANRAKDDFLAHVSHELRTPLNAILGWTRLLSAGLDEEKGKRAIATIERNAESMTQLIDDLLDVSRIISGKMRLEVESVDLGHVVERALESVKLSADAKNIRVHTSFDARGATIAGDSGRLQQVVWNLLSNAVKFTPRDGAIHIALRRVDASLELAVRDSGQGIGPDKLVHVFQPFWQEGGPHVASTRGLGLGLAISKSLVELHGGRIRVESEGAGRGACFIVELPVANLRTTPTEAVSPKLANTSLPQLVGLRVLVVEDDDDARELVQSVLETAGCVVTVAGSVASAMESFEREMPDILLSDIGLPDETGYDLIRKIRVLPADRGGRTPAAAITAYARAEDRLKALGAGFVVHISKPVNPNELLMVAAALASHASRRN